MLDELINWAAAKREINQNVEKSYNFEADHE